MSERGTHEPVRRPGGRTARTTDAVHAAVLRLLATRGVQGFGVDDVAREAGVHKVTVYRRWASLPALLGDVATELIEREVSVPDTGTLAGDLGAFAQSLVAVVNDPVGGRALTSLFSAPGVLAEVDAVIARFWSRRLLALRPVVERAVDRGEVPAGTSTARLFECLGAPLYYRLLITRQPVDAAVAVRATRVAVAAARDGLLTDD